MYLENCNFGYFSWRLIPTISVQHSLSPYFTFLIKGFISRYLHTWLKKKKGKLLPVSLWFSLYRAVCMTSQVRVISLATPWFRDGHTPVAVADIWIQDHMESLGNFLSALKKIKKTQHIVYIKNLKESRYLI